MQVDLIAVAIVSFILLGFILLARVVSLFKDEDTAASAYQNYFSYFYGAGSIYLFLFHASLYPFSIIPKYLGNLEYFVLLGIESLIVLLFTFKVRFFLFLHLLLSIALCGLIGFYIFEKKILLTDWAALAHCGLIIVILSYILYLKNKFNFSLFPPRKLVEMTAPDDADA